MCFRHCWICGFLIRPQNCVIENLFGHC
uniref:Uncharacterized protein n=1 Tax=Arundo donax TaxID=35708 RepID=A0A0A9AHJ0_ARUDO